MASRRELIFYQCLPASCLPVMVVIGDKMVQRRHFSVPHGKQVKR